MNVYSELLDLLRREPEEAPVALFGTLTGVSPLEVSIRGTPVSEGLFVPRGTRYEKEHLGATLALLPCEEGFLILFQAEVGA